MKKTRAGKPGSSKPTADFVETKSDKPSSNNPYDYANASEAANFGKLASTFAHELRGPLGAMLTSLHLVESRIGRSDPAAKRGLDRIRRSVWRCDNIINRLLDYSCHEPLSPEETGIDQWLRALFHDRPQPEGVTLTFKPGLGDQRFKIDRNQMRRAIVHIIDNAAQAILDGRKPGSIAVSTRATGTSLEIRIADNGPGIPKDIRDKIFEPLFSSRHIGAGLGLPIAKRIVEMHGGTLSLDSSRGRGTRVTLALPMDPKGPLRD
ncbi:MAG: HAMP domain-containing histidine kinase [Alphaproteobacteria bacterium]|nr:HAMP domain-containing histidine kinase [Alphaproteobacteria bacterium]